jgi:diguanylate cyclase (GGDEF)-like protein
MRVLVIDDEASLRDIVRALLVEAGCEAVSFASCEDTWRSERGGSPVPDLILLDDLDPTTSVRVRRQLAALLPGSPIACLTESTVEATLTVLRAARGHRTQREQELTARVRRLKAAKEGLERLVCSDPLTGLANRRHFDDLLAREWRRAIRASSQLSLVMLDLDYFHALNERSSHLGGDACLKRVARAMAHCLRRPSDIVARYGGDEFVALLPDTDAAGAWVVAQRLRMHVEQLQLPHEGSRCSSVVTLSAGTATSTPVANRGCETLLAAADVALFRAKQEGRNRTCAESAVPEIAAVARPPWPPCPVVIAEPYLAPRVARFLEVKRTEIPPTREALQNTVSFGRVSAIGQDLRRMCGAFGFEALTELGERLEHAVGQGERDDALRLLDELAWYIDHVQVVYRRAGRDTGKFLTPHHEHASEWSVAIR